MRYALIMLFTALASQALAQTFPQGCHPVVIKDEIAQLTVKKAALFLIYNNTKNTLWLTHPENKGGMSAGWSSQLDTKHWSAISLGRDFTLNCIESIPGHEQQIPCKDAIEICEYKKITFPDDGKGSYWAAENISLQTLISAIEKRGFKLPNMAPLPSEDE